MDETEISQCVAAHTGLSADRIARIMRLGEPWPFVNAFGELLRVAHRDAETANTPLEIALNANADLMELGAQSLSAESIERHLDRTIDVTGESEETIRAVHTALNSYFRMKLDDLDQILRRTRP